MTIISTLNKLGCLSKGALKACILTRQPNVVVQALRKMAGGGGHGDRVMLITPSRFNYKKFKDDLHFYISIGVIPLGLLILGVNIFIGPATLTEIPEGYEPEEHEYYNHPIPRFFVKYFHDNPQVLYEKNIHHLWETEEKVKWRETIEKARKLMAERDDYRGWYYLPSDRGKIARHTRKNADEFMEKIGHK